MSSPSEISARQTLFLIRESSATRKIAVPESWQSTRVHSLDQLLKGFDQATHKGLRMLLIVAEGDLDSCHQLIKLRAQKGKRAVSGYVVISSQPKDYLLRASFPDSVLDVISEKEFRRDPELILSRALLQLDRMASSTVQRIGPQTLERLTQIFIELSGERDSRKLLEKILLTAIDLAQAEGGTLYMVDEIDGEMYFPAKLSTENGRDISFSSSKVRAVENSICGYASLTGKVINIADLKLLKPLTLPQFNRGLDHESQQTLKSLLTLPFKNSRNENVALLQLVNKRAVGNPENFIIPFESEDESLLMSFGTQAAVCLENVDLYQDIQKLFDGFVRASITAIESRDPSTGGHSERVAKMSVALARATSECTVGIYRSVRFKEEEIKELEYASMLHDFGKIGVREEVLVKAKKLYSHQLESIHERIKICKAAARILHLERQLQSGSSSLAWEKEYLDRIKQIDEYWEIVQAANEPSILIREKLGTLEKIRSEQLLLPDGTHVAVLSEEEYKALSVNKGSLTDSERVEVESHVRHTYQFLKMIPWTRDFRHLTEIAYCHHEKLDGSGYPRGLYTHEIPLQSKIMTIADIYDALTAADRWYKEAVPTERALDILGQEVAEGKVDPVLFELFVEKKIYLLTLPKLSQEAI